MRGLIKTELVYGKVDLRGISKGLSLASHFLFKGSKKKQLIQLIHDNNL